MHTRDRLQLTAIILIILLFSFSLSAYSKNSLDSNAADIELNSDELAYISTKEAITVAVVDNFHPLFCLNTAGIEHNGLIPDILNEITEFTGLNFTYVYAYNYSEAIELVKKGKADILGFFLGLEEDAHQIGLTLSSPYVSINKIVMRNKSVNYPDSNLTGAVLEGETLPNNISVSQVIYYPTVSEALSAVDCGEADFVYGLSTYLESEVQKQYYANVVSTTLVNNYSNISFAFSKSVEANLLTIINKSLSCLTGSEHTNIISSNMVSVGTNEFSLTKLIYSNPVAFVGIVTVFLCLIVVIVIVMSRYRIHNITMQNQLERSEAANSAKSSFLSRMSHEIRTPMNAIIGLTDLTCQMSDVPEAAKDNLKKINSSSHYLLSLINDILDMSRIDNGMMQIKYHPFSMEYMIGEIKNLTETIAKSKGITFTIATKLIHDVFDGDEVRLQQILMNLISNAIKFTPAGGHVTLSIKETSSRKIGADLNFSVTDNGIGIPLKKQKIIFEAFEQISSKYSKKEGTGLGLPISSNLVNLMGGELCVKSEVGKGSEFFFSIVLAYAKLLPAKDTIKKSNDLLVDMRILLAEDNDLNAEIAIKLLERQGAVVDRTSNGLEAVKMFTESDIGKYHTILMDLTMPEMNGLDAARTIRSLNRADALFVPIIAMTANSFKEDCDAAYEAGMNGFIAKPLKTNYLYEVIVNHLQ